MFDHLASLDIVDMLGKQLDELERIVDLAIEDRDRVGADARIDRWQKRTGELISDQIDQGEGERLKEIRLTSQNLSSPISNVVDLAAECSSFVRALMEDVEQHPDSYGRKSNAVAAIPNEPSVNPIEQSRRSDIVFLVHGHDGLNLSRLESLLKERWHLNPIILKAEPGQGRTLIEKFEQEAEKAGFAFALLTPDDLVETPDGTYSQPRPNVVFELGWFYGRLGRKNVCILSKKGMAVHSDLAGINRLEFAESIEEAFLQIESELEAGGLI